MVRPRSIYAEHLRGASCRRHSGRLAEVDLPALGDQPPRRKLALCLGRRGRVHRQCRAPVGRSADVATTRPTALRLTPKAVSTVSRRRTSPAEQAVLESLLLSRDAGADVAEVLWPGAFYRALTGPSATASSTSPAAVSRADALTVAPKLQCRGEHILGGTPYRHRLTASVPSAANPAHHAEIVAQKAVLRRLVEAGARIVQLRLPRRRERRERRCL
ncbi:DnaB-like helicase N-terminal domain-containing protein [Pseudonocardia xinjiangensis]|uniref:DnaB-like helicase N-terminal domain-containing protein n=1 Tax=Pseudonocardia xinjiangensis TaxID=75289 RepID=UPI003D936EA9